MSSTGDKSEGLRLLEGLENGTLSSADCYIIAKDRDPVLVYFILRFLREKYDPTDPAAKGVLERLVELTGTYTDIVKMVLEGEKDIMREWFDDGYTVRQYSSEPETYINLIVDKLEG